MAVATPARADVLTVNATGTIGTSCSIAATTPFTTPNLSANGNVGAQATVNCNTGFKVNALSANGAIKSSTSAPTNFTNTLPYNFTLSVPLETGGPAAATCASSALVAGQSSCALSPANSTGLSSGGKASINKTAALTVAWSLPTLPTRLIAGSYGDTITLTVAAVP
jgi:hypothetical protein